MGKITTLRIGHEIKAVIIGFARIIECLEWFS